MIGFAQLLIKIEKLRCEMHSLAAEKGLNHQEVVRVSQQLDNMLNEYYKIKSQRTYSLNPDTRIYVALNSTDSWKQQDGSFASTSVRS